MKWLDDFHEHKISNTEWVWNGDEERGVERNKTEGNAQRFWIYIFSIRIEVGSRICTCKTERTLQMSGKCVQLTQSCLRTPLFNLRTKTRQENQCNEASHPQKRAQRCLNIKYGEISLRENLLHCRQKPQPLYEMKWNWKQGKMQSD